MKEERARAREFKSRAKQRRKIFRRFPYFGICIPSLCSNKHTVPNKIGDQLSAVTLISPGKKPASSTVFLSELLNLVCFLFFSILPY